MATKSLTSELHLIWSWVMNEKGGMVCGIHGSGGVGKTTLLRRVQVKSASTPSILIWVTVSGSFRVGDLQDEIWRKIGSLDQKWVEKSIDEKAKCICSVLSQNRFVLFLDDLWEPIKLKSLGVPKEGKKNLSKVIFTTRSEYVIDSMAPNLRIKKRNLMGAEASQFFETKVGTEILFKDPRIYNLCGRIAKRCYGLPLLLCTVARAMALRRTYEEWEYALEELETYRPWKEGMEVFSLLKFCFDSLPNDIVRCCFLYFSLFPEDFSIPKNDLIDFWITEEFFGYYDRREGAIDMGCDVIDILIKANLFEEENESVKMLDMVRDFALSVIFESKMLNNAQLINAKKFKTLGGAGRVSLMENSIENLPKITPDLLTFFLQRNPFIMTRNWRNPFIMTKDQFIAKLTVLDFSNSCIEEVPRGISKLVSLQYLNLSHTWIERLPIELKELVQLKCLNLENNDQLRIIPRQVISSLSLLQILRMFRCGFSLQDDEDNILSVTNMDINELKCLRSLKVLSITLTCASALENLFSMHMLSNCTEALSLEVFWGSKSLDISPVAAMKHLLTLEIHHAEHLGKIHVNFMDTSFTSLREVNVGKCSNLQDLSWVILAPNLAILRVSSCPEIEEIVKSERLGEIQDEDRNSFAKLEFLELESLSKLKSVYWKALPFQSLKKIQVVDCPLLKRLPLNANSASRIAFDIDDIEIVAEKHWWKQIEWEDAATESIFHFCFKVLENS